MKHELPADGSCFIYLARIDGFAQARRCVESLTASDAVWREAVLDGEQYGYEDAQRIRDAEETGFVRRLATDAELSRVAGRLATTWYLGQGESETLAVGQRVGRAVVDDGRATRVAKELGVEPVSTLFLPALGVLRGLDAEDAIPFLRDLAIVMNARAEAVFAIEEFIRRST
jgi:predicted nucleic acid-binding protein